MDEFVLGSPAVVCRWRLANGKIPLENRHLRALGERSAKDNLITPALVAWAKQHLEWTLSEGSSAFPNGVLMLVIDKSGKAAMTVGAYEPLEHVTANDLLQRANLSRKEAMSLRVSPEDLWVVREDTLVWGTSSEFYPSGSSSLIADLAFTLGMPVVRDDELLRNMATTGFTNEEVFLVSDEHGVVASSDRSGARAQKFAASYQKLLQKQ